MVYIFFIFKITCYKIKLGEMYSFMNFNAFPSRSKGSPPPLRYKMGPHTCVALCGHSLPLPQPLASSDLFSILIPLPFPECHRKSKRSYTSCRF